MKEDKESTVFCKCRYCKKEFDSPTKTDCCSQCFTKFGKGRVMLLKEAKKIRGKRIWLE